MSLVSVLYSPPFSFFAFLLRFEWRACTFVCLDAGHFFSENGGIRIFLRWMKNFEFKALRCGEWFIQLIYVCLLIREYISQKEIKIIVITK